MKHKKSVMIITYAVLSIILFLLSAINTKFNTFAKYDETNESAVLTTQISMFSKANIYSPTMRTTAATTTTNATTTTVATTTAKKTTVQKKSSKKTAAKKKVKERYQIIRGYSPPKNVNTSFKSYMSFRAITCVNSNQYILQQKAHTDKNGIRRVGKDVCIALGTRYSSTVGERFLIELDTGQRFTAVVGDIKSDAHTDKKTHSYIKSNGNVVEFIVDDKKISNDIKFTGNVSCIDKYKGKIKALVKIY